MPQNVEYPTLPVNEKCYILTAFLGWKYPKSSNKKIIWLHTNHLFNVKIRVNVNKYCENEKKKWNVGNVGKPTSPLNENVVVISEAAIGLVL